MLHNPKYNMTYISNFLAMRNAANAPPTVPASAMTQPSNSANDADDCLDETQLESMSTSTGKSFTIASILGLKKKNAAAAAAAANLESSSNVKSKELTVMNLSMHNNHNYPMHNKPAVDVDNRLLTNRIPLAFAHHHHHLQANNPPHHHPPHFYQNNSNNNNNNLHTTNQNGPSALQSLQQQFHAKSGQAFSTFHGKEQRSKTEHSIKSKSMKSKRVRTIFTPEQLERLEAEFERQQYMVGPERLYLAHTLQLTEAQVKVWFQNRRIKWRKHHLEMTQQRLAIIRQRQVPGVENKIVDGGDAGVGSDKSPTANTSAQRNLNAADFERATSAALETSITIDSELSICSDSMASSSNHDVDDL